MKYLLSVPLEGLDQGRSVDGCWDLCTCTWIQATLQRGPGVGTSGLKKNFKPNKLTLMVNRWWWKKHSDPLLKSTVPLTN